MTNLKKILFVTTMTVLIYSCTTETKKQEKEENQTEQKVAENNNVEGNYVNNSYNWKKRSN